MPFENGYGCGYSPPTPYLSHAHRCLQSTAALSTTKVEYVAVNDSIKEATWLRGLIIELGVAQDTIVVLFDSQSGI